MSLSEEKRSDPPARGLGRLKHDSAETVAELREFLGNMQGKNPQELMGSITGSSLVKSTLLGTGLIAAFLLLTSTIAYMVTPENSKADIAKTKAAVQSDAAKDDNGEDSQTAVSDSGKAAESDSGSGDKTIDALGIGETKTVPADKNPLEDKFDDLLDKKID